MADIRGPDPDDLADVYVTIPGLRRAATWTKIQGNFSYGTQRESLPISHGISSEYRAFGSSVFSISYMKCRYNSTLKYKKGISTHVKHNDASLPLILKQKLRKRVRRGLLNKSRFSCGIVIREGMTDLVRAHGIRLPDIVCRPQRCHIDRMCRHIQ